MHRVSRHREGGATSGGELTMPPEKKPYWRDPLFWTEVAMGAAMFAAIFGVMAIGVNW